jgi:hypothetical protein
MKKTIENYITLIKNSFTQPNSYKKWVILPKKHVLSFFVISMLLIGFFRGVYFSIAEIPKILTSFTNFQEKIVSQYPEDLVISWNEEKLSLSPKEKYENADLDLAQLFESEFFQPNLIRYRAQFSSEDEKQQLIADEQTFAVISPEEISFMIEDEENGDETKIVTEPLKDIIVAPGFSLQHDDLPAFQQLTNEKIKYFQPKIQKIFPFFIMPFFLSGQFFVSLFYATFLWIFSKLAKFPVKTWRQNWKLTLSILVTVSYIELLVKVIYPNIVSPIQEVAFWAIAAFVLLSWKFPEFFGGKKIKKIKKSK